MVDTDTEYIKWKASQAKPWCSMVRGAAEKHADALANAEQLRQSLDLVGAIRYSDMPGNPNAYGDAVPDAVARIMEADAALMETAAEYATMVKEFTTACTMLDARYSHLLNLRYVQRREWGDIADEVGYADSYVRFELKTAALAALYDVMPHKYRSPMPSAC